MPPFVVSATLAVQKSSVTSMDAECSRASCAQRATLLLAYDPRGARAWLRDLVDAHPAMGLILCREHGETTTVPMSWELIDERAPDFDSADSGFADEPVPSFDDIFPPRVTAEPDPYGMAGDELDIRQPLLEPDEAEEVIANDPAMATLNISEEDEFDTEAVELLAPDLQASGTDGAVIAQPQLPMHQIPMIKTPPQNTATQHPGAQSSGSQPQTPGADHDDPPFDPLPSASFNEALAPSPNPMDFLFEEDPDDALPVSPFEESDPTGATTESTTGRRTYTSPIFSNTDVSPQQLNVSPSATLLSRAFRSAQFE